MIKPSQFPEPGLYLIFPNGERMDLTRKFIEDTAEKYLSDPDLIPPNVKAAADYQLCDICPERGRAELCHAIMPALAIAQKFEEHMSYDSVVVIYREDEQPMIHAAETSTQNALQFITILSLMEYCETGRYYARYFRGVNPLMPIEQISEQVFYNMYLHLQGNSRALEEEATRMEEQFHFITTCQISRLRLICKSDALPNAFANMHALALLIFLNIRQNIARRGKPAQDRPDHTKPM